MSFFGHSPPTLCTVSRSPCDRVPVAAAPSSANLSLNLMSASPTVLYYIASPPRAPLPRPATARALFAATTTLCPHSHARGSFASAVARFRTCRGPVIPCMEIELVSRYGSWSSSTIRTDAPRPPCSSITDCLLTYSPTATPSPLPADLAWDPPRCPPPPLPSRHLSSHPRLDAPEAYSIIHQSHQLLFCTDSGIN